MIQTKLGNKLTILLLVFGILALPGLAFSQMARQSLAAKCLITEPLLSLSGVKISALVSRPGQSMNYSYSTGAWQHVANSSYSYDAQGRISYQLTTNPAGQNLIRQYYSYDANGFNTEYTTDIWRNNAWAAGYGFRYLETYNAAGYITESIYQEREPFPGGSNWVNKGKWVITFNAQNQQTGSLKSQWDSNTNSWEDKYRFVNFVHNVANEVIAYTQEENVNGVWQDSRLYSNIVWENKNGPMLSYTAEVFINNVAISGSKYAKVYGLNGGYVETFQNLVNGVWETSMRDIYDHDAFGNPLGWKREYWQNGNWVKTSHQNYIHTYNANNDITETVNQDFQAGTQTYNNSGKKVFSNFQYFNIAGLKDKTTPEFAVNVFPNPTENMLNIEISDNEKLITAQLSDLTGKIILSYVFKTSEPKQLNLENLKPGIYFLHLQSDNGKTVRKIIKN